MHGNTGYGKLTFVIHRARGYGVWEIDALLSTMHGNTGMEIDALLSIMDGNTGYGNSRFVIHHAREYGVWKTDTLLSIMHGNTGYWKFTLCFPSCTGTRGMGNWHFVIHHAREHGVWEIYAFLSIENEVCKINSVLSIWHGNTVCAKLTLIYTSMYSLGTEYIGYETEIKLYSHLKSKVY